ncbi:MAG: holo-ACP synthase [Acidimicrobiales bacterium]
MGPVGIGIDTVDVDRFAAALARWPGLASRLFTEAERETVGVAGSAARRAARLAARFAAKEAVMKSLGVGLGAVRFVDVEVVTAASGAPSLVVHGRAAALAVRSGVEAWMVSLTHTDHHAMACVLALGGGATRPAAAGGHADGFGPDPA